MAKSKFEYVKEFERDERLLPGCWIVVRLDGRGFTRFCDDHGFCKPNDEGGLRLMDRAAQVFPDKPLMSTPVFDGRTVCYPSTRSLRDYLSWRQTDTHINNLYNTCFWKLVESGVSRAEAHNQLKGTVSAEKNEMLFTKFGLSYNAVLARFRKGSIVVRSSCLQDIPEYLSIGSLSACTGTILLHVDIISNDFWDKTGLLQRGEE